jgi:tetratricopeptide (TPR) repeat protein
MRLTLAAMLALLWLAPAAALAADPAAPQDTLMSAQEQQDQQAVDAAYRATAGRGPIAIGDHVPALEAVLDHAPKDFKAAEERDGKLIYHANGVADFLVFSASMRARWKSAGEKGEDIVWVRSPYPVAALLLGAYYNEVMQPERAIPYLQRGLALAPHDPMLITETGLALAQAHRLDEALALYQKALTDPDLLVPDQDKARILRGKGFALTELGRLDEAEQCYRDSLVLEPGHAGAMHELQYIAHLKAGGARAPASITTADKAKTGAAPKQP